MPSPEPSRKTGVFCSASALFRIYYTRAVTAACGCCGESGRLGVVDLDGRFPLCQSCLPASIQAAEALRCAGMIPPDFSLIERNP